jgi:hypothetical protein
MPYHHENGMYKKYVEALTSILFRNIMGYGGVKFMPQKLITLSTQCGGPIINKVG